MIPRLCRDPAMTRAPLGERLRSVRSGAVGAVSGSLHQPRLGLAPVCRHPITMRVPPPRPAGAPGYTAPGHEPSPLYAARLVGLRVTGGAASATSERYATLAERCGSQYRS